MDIAGANTALASFTPDFAGDYRISLDVDDGADTGRDEVLIAAALPNVAPNADAGADLIVQLGAGAALDGAASNDPDSGPTPLSFQWTFVNVPVDSLLSDADLSGATTVAPSFTPDLEGFYLLRLDVSDGDLMDMDQVQVKANVAPVAMDDAFTVAEDTGLNEPAPGVLGNDSDGTSDPLTAVLDTDVNKGTLALNPNGSFTYTPATDFEGTDSFTYRANDGTVDSTNLATVTITVGAVDDPPVAVDDVATVNEDAPATTIAVLANDTDLDGGAKTITAVQSPSANGGTVLITNGGADLTYQPAANFCSVPPDNTPDTFTYTLSPGGSTATVSVTVDCVDDPPVAANDALTINEDASATTIAVLANDPDLDGGLKAITAVQNPSANGGTVTNGGADLTYQPAADFCNAPPGTTPDTFTYTLSPGGSTASVSVTVNCVNDAPVIANLAGDILAYTQGDLATPIDQGADATATDVDSPDFDTGTLTVSLPGGLVPAEDQIGIRNQGTGANQIGVTGTDVTFNPGGGAVIIGSFSGGGAGGGNLVVTLNTNANAAAVSALLRNVTYVNSNTVAPDIANRTARFVLSDGDGGTSINYDTIITVTPNVPPTLDAISDPDAINEDASQQTIDLTGITAGGAESQPLQVTATSNNTALIPDPTVTYTSPDTSGSLAYTPVANAFGTAIVTVTVTDGGVDGNLTTVGDNGIFTRTFTVTVDAVNDPPTLDAIADPAPINEDAPEQNVDLAGISAGGGESQTLQVTATSNNTGLIPNPTVIYASPDPTGSLTYTPVANAFGTAIVTVTVTDAGLDDNFATPSDNLTVTRTFTVTVIEVNNPPTLDVIADPVAINEDASQQTVSLAGITAGSGETQPLQVTATSNNTSLIPNPTVTYTTPNTAGSLAYTPVPDAFGTAVVTVTVTDGGPDGNLATAGDNGIFTRTFTVAVNAVDDPPTLNAIADPAPINEDAPEQTVDLAGISAGGGESQTLQVTATSNNTGLIPNPTVIYASPDPTGSLAYTPEANQSGTGIVTVTVTDGGLDDNLATTGDNLTVTRTFTVTVIEVNDPPTLNAIADPVAINEDAGQQTVNLAGITAGSDETQPLQVTATSNSTGLIPNPTVTYTSPTTTGSLAYTPVANAFGTAVMTVTVTDGGPDGNLATAGDNGIFTRTFTVTVNPVNDAPSFAASNPPTVLEDAGPHTVLNWAMFNPGPANEAQTVVGYTVSNVFNSALFSALPAVAANGTLTYTPADNAFGTSTFDVAVQDNGGIANGGDDTSDAQTFTITVTPVNDAPVATAKSHQTHSGIRVTIGAANTGKLKDGATDVDDPFGDLAVNATFGNITPAAATITLTDAATGTFTYNPPAGHSGAASFQFQVCDDGAPTPPAMCSAATTVSFNVTGPDLWFVDTTAGAGGTGRRTDPFDALSDLPAARGNGDRIFVFTGTYGTGQTLLTSEHLIGQGSSGTFDSVLGVTVPGNGTLDTRPLLGGTRPQLNGTVTVAGSSVVRGLNIVTSGATGLTGSAVSGVTVSEASVSATNATAVNLGASGTFTLTRVDSSNAANGIILNNNPTGSFTVTGTGAAGTGGTIQNITTRGASFINASNVSLTNMSFTNASQNDGPTAPDGVVGGNSDENGAIHLQSAANVALTGVTITTTAQHGINGNGVRNLDLTNVTISGTGNEVWESGMFISNLAGRVSASQDSVFQNLNVSNTGQFNIFITNGTPTVAAPAEKDRLSITNSQFSNSGINVIGDHITVANVGTANFETLVSGSSFTALVDPSTHTSDNIQIDASGSSSSNASISTSTFSNAGQAAINLSASGNGVGTFAVTNNSNVSVRAATGINLSSVGPSSLRGTISGNTISTNVTNNPAFGIQFVVNDVGSIIANINNNTINGDGTNDFDYGIRGGARIGNGTADITLQDNTVQSAEVAGVWLFSGNASPGESSRTCVNFVSNLIDGGSLAFTDYFVEQYTNTTFQIQGLVGLGTNATNVQNFIAATDDDPAALDPTVDAGSGTTVNYTNATCATP
ncbi:MAG: tandem-95 repeat protein [Gammaproteobacteria bacterium]